MGKSLEEIEINLYHNPCGEENIVWLSPNALPLRVFGLLSNTEGRLERLPQDVADRTNSGVAQLGRHLSGGRVCFETDSKFVAVRVVQPYVCHMSNTPLTACSGLDLYVCSPRCEYFASFVPPEDTQGSFCGKIEFEDARVRRIVVYLPLYGAIDSLEFGFDGSATVKEFAPYKAQPPIVYYGSSITQGAAASRSGLGYVNIIGRTNGFDYVNLGFSGSAKAEPPIIEYISKLDMSLFVLDYDYNAPTADYLESTHWYAYSTVRAEKPELPIVLVSKPNFNRHNPDDAVRRAIVRATYEKARAKGDDNVFFVDGESLFGIRGRDMCTADTCHPNDLGFARMADKIGRLINKILMNRR